MKPGSQAALLGATRMLVTAIDQKIAGEIDDLTPFTGQVQTLLRRIDEEDALEAEELRPMFERWIQIWSESTAGAPVSLYRKVDYLLGQTYADQFVAGAWHAFRQLMAQATRLSQALGEALQYPTFMGEPVNPATAPRSTVIYEVQRDDGAWEQTTREGYDKAWGMKTGRIVYSTDFDANRLDDGTIMRFRSILKELGMNDHADREDLPNMVCALLGMMRGRIQSLKAKRPSLQEDPLTDNHIAEVWAGMPDGHNGFLKTWGFLQFGRELVKLDRKLRGEEMPSC